MKSTCAAGVPSDSSTPARVKNSEGKLRRKGEHFMSTEENKVRVRRFYEEVFNQKKDDCVKVVLKP